MKKSIKMISAIFIAIVAIVATSCNSSDPETEQALAGTWQTSFNETEDGITMHINVVESYSLEDHKFTSKITINYGYPINEHLCTITWAGEWEASKTVLTTQIDENSIEFSFNKGITDRSDREEIKSEMISGLKEQSFMETLEFKSPITDSFEAVDGEGESFTYTRMN